MTDTFCSFTRNVTSKSGFLLSLYGTVITALPVHYSLPLDKVVDVESPDLAGDLGVDVLKVNAGGQVLHVSTQLH